MENSKHHTSPENDNNNYNEPASISFKQNLESRSNFDYFNPDQKMLKEQREKKSEIDSELDELL